MKIKKLLIFFGCMLALNSCSNSSDDEPQTSPLEGTWRLTNVSGGIQGTSDDFNDGSIIWTFNADGSINIWNTNTDDTKTDLIESGIYNYAFVPNNVTPENCAQALAIDGTSYGCYNIDGNTLTLNQVESDGYLVTLEKVEISALEE